MKVREGIRICGQHGCERRSAYRYTWPGRDENGVCEEHRPKLVAVARAIGLHLQLVPLSRWAILKETTPSGKQLFLCRVCGRKSPTPDKMCPAGCEESWEE